MLSNRRLLIADYGRDKPDLKLYQPPRPEEAALRALTGRRAELKDLIQDETSRLEHAFLKAVRLSLESHLAALKGQLALIEKEIRALTRRDEVLQPPHANARRHRGRGLAN